MSTTSPLAAKRFTTRSRDHDMDGDGSNPQTQSRLAAEVPAAITRQLLESVVTIAGDHPQVAERRRQFLAVLAEVVRADAGFWAWGRGRPGATAITPVAIIDFGFTDKQRAVVIDWGLDTETNRSFQTRILSQLGNSRQTTSLWRDVYSPAEWEAAPPIRGHIQRGGWESFLHGVRYSTADTWSNLFLLRNREQAEFGPQEAAIVDLAMTSVPWLHSTAEEFLPPESFAGLTPRQRTVMLLLLDGLPRKQIAKQLEIGEETVGDHIKSIYSHFHVNSATELAALFLRSR